LSADKNDSQHCRPTLSADIVGRQCQPTMLARVSRASVTHGHSNLRR